jgi:DNA-binding Lrp family transcriptional regulator
MTTSLQFIVRDQREPGWFFVDNEIIDKFGERLRAYGVAVYAVLSRYSREQQVHLSQRDIANALGISQGCVRASLRDLVEAGLIHVEVPARPSPGIISTITMLRVKATEYPILSSRDKLSASRARNKEVKTKTETKIPSPSSLFDSDSSLEENALAREASHEPNRRVVTESSEKTHCQKDFDERDIRELAKAWRDADRRRDSLGGSSEDQIYEWVCKRAGVTIDRALRLDKLQRTWPQGLKESTQLSPDPTPVEVCDECNGYAFVRQSSDIPGPRLLPCPKCGADKLETQETEILQ